MAGQPDLNYRNPSVAAEMRKILQFWLGKGVAGFRVDAINHMFEDELLRDEPLNPNEHNPQSYDRLYHVHTKDLVRNIFTSFFSSSVANFRAGCMHLAWRTMPRQQCWRRREREKIIKKCERHLVASFIFIILHKTKFSTVNVLFSFISNLNFFCSLYALCFCAVSLCPHEQYAHGVCVLLLFYKIHRTEANRSHNEKRNGETTEQQRWTNESIK